MASSDLALFDWWIPQTGFRWVGGRASRVFRPRRTVQIRPGPQLFLAQVVENDVLEQRLPLRDEPALFRTFAELESTDLDSVRAFANQHGWLGLDARDDQPMRVPDPRSRDRKRRGDLMVRGEGLAEWATAIFAVRQAVDLLEAAEEGDKKRLESWITTVEDGFVLYRRREGRPTRAVARQLARQWELENPQSFIHGHRQVALTFQLETRIRIDATSPVADYIREGDFKRAARFVAQRLINQGLAPHTSAACVFDPDAKTFGRHVVPDNLLGAIWVQVAGMAEGGRAYRRCEQCKGWFVLSPEINRADRAYCSDRCRHKAYRDRRQRARGLHAKGMTPAKIARELASDTQTVRGWLGAQS